MKCPIVITPYNAIEKADNSIARMLRSPFGKRKLAQAMINPIRTSLDYAGIARKCFVVQQLPTAALPVYSKDPDLTSIVKDNYKFNSLKITSNNNVIKKDNGFFARRVTIPRFEIYKSPTVNLSDIKTRRFSLIDRYK